MKNYILFIYLIGLDIITTTICILLGGIEYNPISMFVMKQSYLLFIIVKITLIYLIYYLGKNTNVFNEIYGKIMIYPLIIIFIIVNILNSIYIIFKVFGVI